MTILLVSKKVSSYFHDTEETKMRRQVQVPSLEIDDEVENNDHSEAVELKASKKTKVDTSLIPVNIEFADITKRDMNDNSRSIKFEGLLRGAGCWP